MEMETNTRGNGSSTVLDGNNPAHSAVEPNEVHSSLGKHMLVDGFDIVADLKRSHGSYLYDSRAKKSYIDFFTFFASSPVGFNHPKLDNDEFKDRVFYAAVNKPSNSDIYTTEMAEFVETFGRVAIPDYLPYAFFIEGGGLAVENALKTAFDWKIRKNMAKGIDVNENDLKIAHFKQAFHGRTGYTMSITNTDPNKIRYFPKFDWPRITNPKVTFPLNEDNLQAVEAAEAQAMKELEEAVRDNPNLVAGIIVEPIQGEGGDNHFRPEFFQMLRDFADNNDTLLIFDEVQTGIGLTGKMWAHEHFVKPDILAFGKKMQVCGILASKRLDEVEDHVFHKSSRINSTWGGNLVDMIRSQRYLEIIEEENLVEHAAKMGHYLVGWLTDMTHEYPALSNARGRGMYAAIDCKTTELRDAIQGEAMSNGLLVLPCGERSIRFRPALNISKEVIDEGLEIFAEAILKHALNK
jgi:L-lysine 6-transaminase